MPNYKLLTPGPLTTTDTVKREMLFDHCTWDDDYKQITQNIRRGLLRLAHAEEPDYTVVLMQGSGTFGVEAVLSGIIAPENKLLLLANGAYGERMGDIARYHQLKFTQHNEPYHCIPEAQTVERLLRDDPAITHVAMVHCETTSGILNDVAAIGAVCANFGKTFIVDAMSSFGGIDIPVKKFHIDFLVSSANKCIQGVPGFSFVIANRAKLEASKGLARSLSLDLYDQWQCMEKDGKWRFTSPTHVVLAFARALEELEAEGGVPARNARYTANHRLLVKNMEALGFAAYLKEHLSPIITSFYYPQNSRFSFEDMYLYIKERGYAIYPGKVTQAPTFRIGNIGEIYEEDILKLTDIFAAYRKERQE